MYPAGCASGTVTGNASDRGRCVVVELHLPANGLTGALPSSLFSLGLDSLVELDLRGRLLETAAFVGAPRATPSSPGASH